MMTVAETTGVDEVEAVYRWRFKIARECGLSIVEASLFADSAGDLAELRRLVELGCPADLISEIVL